MKTHRKPIVILLGLTLSTIALGGSVVGSEPDADRARADAEQKLRQKQQKARSLENDGRVANEASWLVTTGAEKRIVDALAKKVKLDFEDTPLKDALSFIARQQKIHILIDEAAFNEEGLSSDEPINLTVSDITLATALRIMCEPLQICYLVEDGVLKITTVTRKEDPDEPVVRLYDVRRLLNGETDAHALAAALRQIVSVPRPVPQATLQIAAFRHLLIARTRDLEHQEIVRVLSLLESALKADSTEAHGGSHRHE